MRKTNLNSTIIEIWSEDTVNNIGEDYKIIQIEHAYEDKYMVEVYKNDNTSRKDMTTIFQQCLNSQSKQIPLN